MDSHLFGDAQSYDVITILALRKIYWNRKL